MQGQQQRAKTSTCAIYAEEVLFFFVPCCHCVICKVGNTSIRHVVCPAHPLLPADHVGAAVGHILDDGVRPRKVRCDRRGPQRPVLPQQHLPVPLHQGSPGGRKLLQLRPAPLRLKQSTQTSRRQHRKYLRGKP
ncbi:hypothetical protein CDAR_518421 [Caerostris darwini]|uniref:Uncharacterized protein n=1 Tax=Caerostris darwini TaxID=1538125 RepID=A0AAV4R2K5_9ARAC|nr:hypothetical protein CDAR_518421 [Caerostris darwini]